MGAKHEKGMPKWHTARYYAVIISISVLVIFGVSGTVMLLLNQPSAKENTFQGGQLSVSEAEEFNRTVKQNVKVQNNGIISAKMRAIYVVNWVDEAGGVYPVQPAEGTDYTVEINGEQWKQAADGYYYCDTVVEKGAASPVFIKTCQAVSGRAPDGYQLQVNVLADAVQSVGNAHGDAWTAQSQAYPPKASE